MSQHEREVVPVSRHEREVVSVSRHERETVTTSHYDDFPLRRRPSISMTFHYDETFLTRSPRHIGEQKLILVLLSTYVISFPFKNEAERTAK